MRATIYGQNTILHAAIHGQALGNPLQIMFGFLVGQFSKQGVVNLFGRHAVDDIFGFVDIFCAGKGPGYIAHARIIGGDRTVQTAFEIGYLFQIPVKHDKDIGRADMDIVLAVIKV